MPKVMKASDTHTQTPSLSMRNKHRKLSMEADTRYESNDQWTSNTNDP